MKHSAEFQHKRAIRGKGSEKIDILKELRLLENLCDLTIVEIVASGQFVTQELLDKRKQHENDINSLVKRLQNITH